MAAAGGRRSEDRECPWLTMADGGVGVRNGTEMARLVRTTTPHTWQRWHQLVMVRSAPGDRLPRCRPAKVDRRLSPALRLLEQ